jgi:surface protein
MSVYGSANLTRTNTFTLTKDGLIKAINEVKNIPPKNRFLCASDYNLLLEMHIIISFHDENLSISKVFEFLSCEYTGRYFFDFFINPIRTDNDIRSAVKLWCSDRDSALAIYGHISFWNTSQVTNMSTLFKHEEFFNDDISDWDVSNVANMSAMFREAYSFNQPLATWNVSKVINMECMFLGAEAFNQPIGDWNVSNVTNMSAMFRDAYSFNQPLATWNVSKVSNMEWMFLRAEAFNQPIGDWNVSNVTNMDDMFYGATAFNQDIS